MEESQYVGKNNILKFFKTSKTLGGTEGLLLIVTGSYTKFGLKLQFFKKKQHLTFFDLKKDISVFFVAELSFLLIHTQYYLI